MEFNFRSSSAGGQYVYYERLGTDKSSVNNALYAEAKSIINDIEGSRALFHANISGQLMSQAQAEREKEKAFLQNVFEVDVTNYDIEKPGADKEITLAINKVLGLKGQFERATTRLLDKRQTSVTPTKEFTTYFDKAWKEQESQLASILAARLTAKADLETPIRQFVVNVAKQALITLLNSKTMSNEGDPIYAQLIGAIGEFHGGGLLDELYKAYNLDSLVETLEKEMRRTAKKKRLDAAKLAAQSYVKKRNGPSSGKFYESVEREILSMVSTGINGIHTSNGLISLDVQVHHTGASGIKADNIMTFGVDLSPIYTALDKEEKEDSNRANNVKQFEALNKKLQGTGDGYVVYFNDKDYMFGKNFDGFSAGEMQSLENFQATFGDKVSDSLIAALLQTMDGAVGDGLKGTLSEALAGDIAYWLFDDFDTIGNVPESTPSSLHIMSLSGMYVPLSVFLNQLAGAFAEVEGDVSSLVRVTLSSGAIAYPHGDIVSGRGTVWGMEKWESQANLARTQIKVGVHFLGSFKAFMSGLR